MAILFHIRGNSLTPRVNGTGGPEHGVRTASTTQPAPAADASAIGGSSIQFTSASGYTQYGVNYNGVGNWPNTLAFSLLLRISFPSLDANNHALFFCGAGGNSTAPSSIGVWANSTNIVLRQINESALVGINSVTFAHGGLSNDTWYDLVVTGTGDTTTNGYKVYLNGSLLGQTTSTRSWETPITPGSGVRNKVYRDLHFGIAHAILNTRYQLNEAVIWDSVIDPTGNVTLDSGAGLLNGASRTSFVASTANDGSASVSVSIPRKINLEITG